MDNAALMRPFEALADREAILEHLIQRQRTSRQPIGQGLAVETLHHEKIDAVLVADVVERADVRVVQRRDRPRFALEA